MSPYDARGNWVLPPRGNEGRVPTVDEALAEESRYAVESCPECGTVCDIHYEDDIHGRREYGASGEEDPRAVAVIKAELEETEAMIAEHGADADDWAAKIGVESLKTHRDALLTELFRAEVRRINDEVLYPDEWPEPVNPLHKHMRATFDGCLAISRAKNADYSKGASDPLTNFRACTSFGVSLPLGIMVRLSDKMARIGNLLDGREAAVKDERIADSIMDAINYLAILKYALETETLEKEQMT